MRRVLLVAYYFPPIGGIGSIRLASFARYLPEFGWEPTVLAPRTTPHPLDPSIPFDPHQVVRSHSIEPALIARRLAAGVGGGAAPGPREEARGHDLIRTGMRDAAMRFVLYPDAQIGWYPGGVLAGLRTLRRSRFDAIFSSAFPMTSHLIARTLAHRWRLPWVAEYRDPWSDDPGIHAHGERGAALERSIARQASAIVMPSPAWAARYGRQWECHVDVVRNGFDARPAAYAPPDRPTITYLGTYYPGRQRLGPLWEAVARLRAARPDDPPRVLLIGRLPPEGRAELAAAGITDIVEETGLVPHPEAMRRLRGSSVLVASGETARGPLARGWIPAKLFEYLATDLPILYLGDPEDDAARMLAEHPGCHVLDSADATAVDRALAEALDAGAVFRRDLTPLSRRSSAEALAQVLDRAQSR